MILFPFNFDDSAEPEPGQPLFEITSVGPAAKPRLKAPEGCSCTVVVNSSAPVEGFPGWNHHSMEYVRDAGCEVHPRRTEIVDDL